MATSDPLKAKAHKLVMINSEYSRLYMSQLLEREEYLFRHKTDIRIFLCMDGRIGFPYMTESLIGTTTNYRNLGGKFDFGWPMLNYVFRQSVRNNCCDKRPCLTIITYHFSKDDPHRGCAGYCYDKQCSIDGAFAFKDQIDRSCRDEAVAPETIVVGIETDEDALIFHGKRGEILDLSKLDPKTTESELFLALERNYPTMPNRILVDLFPYVLGNFRHIQKIRKCKRPIVDMQHNEWVLGVGSTGAFDWLYQPNTAFLVGQYNPNLARPIRKAAELIFGSIKEGRVKDGFILLAAADYHQRNDRAHSIERARYSARLAREVIEEFCPKLVDYMYPMTIVINGENQKLEIIS